MARMMRAAVAEKPYEIKVKEVEIPELAAGEVLIKVKACGICGTDISIYTGKYSAEYLPLVPGHEFSGVVSKVGESVHGIDVGDHVTADINMSCGTCFYCRRGRKLMCPEFTQLGIHTNGAYAEYVKAPADQVHKLPVNLSFEYGAFVEPFSCVIHACKASRITIGSSVAIIGDGNQGILHTQIAKYLGAGPVILIGKHDRRLSVAKSMGVDYAFNIRDVDPIQEVRRITEGRGADFVIESAGHPETYEQAMAMGRPGGTIVAFGITAQDAIISIKPFDLVLGERTITGSCAGFGNDWAEAIALLAYGRIEPSPLFSLRVPLEEVEDAIKETMENRDLLKVFVCPDLEGREVL